MARRLSLLAPLLLLAGALAAPAQAQEPLEAPGSIGEIELVASTEREGFHWEFFRNRAYPCSISGYQTFAVGTPIGSDLERPSPLWVRMRGGGVGFFDSTGRPQPSAGNKSENDFETLLGFAEDNELNNLVNADAAGFRNLSVSMCNHDIYGGGVQADPNNPNLTAEGTAPTVNGLFATKAAIRFVHENYPTTKTFLHGTSAGSFGTWGVAWSLEQEDRPVAGFVADSGVLNAQYEVDLNAQGAKCARGPEALAGVSARLHPELIDPANQPDVLISTGRLRAPVYNVFSGDDENSCGEEQVACTMSDGQVTVLGSMECKMARVTAAIEALPPSAGSRTATLCVAAQNQPAGDCSRHVVTNVDPARFPNTNPAYPADHNTVIAAWVRDRLADDPPALETSLAKRKNLSVEGGRVRAECAAGGVEERTCRVQLSEPGSRGRRIGSGKASIEAGEDRASVNVKLNARGRRAVRHAPKRGLRVLADVQVEEQYTERAGQAERSYRLR